MKKFIYILIGCLMLGTIACGSSTADWDDTPVEVKVLALGGVLNGMISQMAVIDKVTNEADTLKNVVDGNINEEVSLNEMDVNFAASDNYSIDMDITWTSEEVEDVLTVSMGPNTFNSIINNYPSDGDVEGAVITFDGVDYRVLATSTEGSFIGSINGDFTFESGSYIESSLEGFLDIRDMVINIVTPNEVSATVSMNDDTNQGTRALIVEDSIMLLYSGDVDVTYSGDNYSCNLWVHYYAPSNDDLGNTNVGQLDIVSAVCELE